MMNYAHRVALGIATILLTAPARLPAEQPATMHDLLVHGGMVIDGTGAAAMQADLLIDDGLIIRIGRFNPANTPTKRVIDAAGLTVTPGFIDTHAHGDPLRTPGFENFVAMGVTTICLGQDGASPTDLESWMHDVSALRTGPNVAMFVGHGTARNGAGVGLTRNPNRDQIAAMQREIRHAMNLGCLGMTTGLEYQPGSFSEINELIALGHTVAESDGLVMSHLRSEDDDAIEGALEELLTQGQHRCPVHVSHIKVTYGRGAARAEQVLRQLDAARRSGQPVTADIYPYTASYTGIGIVFPDFAKPPNNYAEVIRTRRAELAAYLRDRVTRRNGPQATLFGTDPWTGMTLADVAKRLGKPFEDVLIDDIGLTGARAAYFVMDDALQERLLVDPHVMICSDGSPTSHHPRGHGAFARVIRKFVREKRLLSLEAAIHKMTGLSAKTIGLDRLKRGRIAEGWAADVLVFDPQRVRDTATYEKPHQLATGFEHVIVNGEVVRERDRANGVRAGRLLKRAHHELHARVDQLLEPFNASNLPGASVAVQLDGRTVLARGVGMADLERKQAADARTCYRLASVTKQFTAMCIALLAERGKLEYDDSITKFLPELPPWGQPMTVRHLLWHTSGIADYEYLISPNQTEQVSDEDVLALVSKAESTYFKPGDQFRYSNSGYALLALIVERVSGRRFSSFLKENIFVPLGMNDSVAYEAGRSTVNRRSMGYREADGSFVDADQSVTSAVLGDGGIYTSVLDYLRWVDALDGAKLVSTATMKEIFTKGRLNNGERLNYGFGWRVVDRWNHAVQQHDGRTSGFNTAVRRVPDKAITIVVLANRSGGTAHRLADELVEWLLTHSEECR